MKIKNTKPEGQKSDWEEQELPLFVQKADTELVEQELPLFGDGAKLQTADISAAMPAPLQQSRKSEWQNTTMFTPVEPVVSFGFLRSYRGINWPHYENMLKLYAVDLFIQNEPDGKPTDQQEKDKAALEEAIEAKGNAKRVRPLTVNEIVKRDSKVYMTYGKDIIYALVMCNEKTLKELHAQITNSFNQRDAEQRKTMYNKATQIYNKLVDRYYNYRGR